MKTITLTISAPIASYSEQPRAEHRLTQSEPTHSAVIGMIACAMGVPRDEPIEHLKELEMKVISVTHSQIETDFQTIKDAVTVDGASGRNIITVRHYAPDYCATIELAGDDSLIDAVEHAVKYPYWQLYAGRRANVLDRPLLTHSASVLAET